jgi:hypothetical protein
MILVACAVLLADTGLWTVVVTVVASWLLAGIFCFRSMDDGRLHNKSDKLFFDFYHLPPRTQKVLFLVSTNQMFSKNIHITWL